MNKCRTLFILILPTILFTADISYSQNSYRDRYMQPEKIMDVVGIKPGMIIGEAGTGEGYFTFWLSKRIGDTGKIYANDIDKRSLNKITNRCKNENISNIQTVVGDIDDPLFPVDTLDIVIMMMAFHDFTKPVEWMQNVISYMKPEAKLVIIDRDPKKLGGSYGHFLTKEEVLNIMNKTDFELVTIETFLQKDNIYIYTLN